MKKQTLLLLVSLFLISILDAQSALSFANTSNSQIELDKTADTPKKEKGEISEKIAQELQLFTDYLATEIEYPEMAQLYNVEGLMVVRVVFDGEIKDIKIVQSLNADCDKLVIKKIKEYASNWDRKDYEDIPLLAFEIPLSFKLQGF